MAISSKARCDRMGLNTGAVGSGECSGVGDAAKVVGAPHVFDWPNDRTKLQGAKQLLRQTTFRASAF